MGYHNSFTIILSRLVVILVLSVVKLSYSFGQYDLALTQNLDKNIASLGDTIQVTLKVHHENGAIANNIVIIDSLNSGLLFIGLAPPVNGGTADYNLFSHTINWQLPSLGGVNQVDSLVFQVLATSEGIFQNKAEITTSTDDIDAIPNNNNYLEDDLTLRYITIPITSCTNSLDTFTYTIPIEGHQVTWYRVYDFGQDGSIGIGDTVLYSTNKTINIYQPGTYFFTTNYENCQNGACGQIIIDEYFVPPTNLVESICHGETYILGTQVLTGGGGYTEVFQAANGCDSVVNLSLKVISTYRIEESALICQGQTYTLGTQTLTNTGSYTETFTNSTGCDSIVNLNLTVTNSITEVINASICQGQTYTLGTQTLTNTGSYTETFTNSAGCDSIINLNLTVIQPGSFTAPSNIKLCVGQSVDLHTVLSNITGNVAFYANLSDAQNETNVLSSIVTGQLGSRTYYIKATAQENVACNQIQAITVSDSGCIFDLALNKSLAVNQSVNVEVGDDILYDICIRNEGEISGYNILVADHIPSGLTLSINDNNNWTIINSGLATKIIAGPIHPGEEACVQILLTLNSGNPGDDFVNIAEIAGQEDEAGNLIEDEDSTPDLIEDNEEEEEDDHDSAIVVVPPCEAVNIIPSSANLCQGENVQLDASISQAGATYRWTPTYGLSDPFIPNPVARPLVSTTYIVEVNLGNAACLEYDTVRVNVFDVPNPGFQVDEVCLGESTNFIDNTVSYTNITGWYWDFGDGIGTSTEQHPSYVYPNAGQYLVKLIATSTNNCQDSILKEVTVLPGAQAGSQGKQDTICIGGCVELLAKGGTSFNWWPGTTLNHTDCFNPIACPTETTTYYVEVSNDFGCRSIDSVKIVVVPGPTVEVTSNNVSQCGNFDGSISIRANGVGNNYQYSIDGGLTFHSNNTFNNLPASSYLVVIKNDACEVAYSGNPVIVGGANSLAITAVSTTHPSCETVNGSISIEADGITELQYSINGGITWTDTNEFTELGSGIYYIAVANADLSCLTHYPPVELVQPVAPTFTDVSFTTPSDCGVNDGTITIIAAGEEGIEYGLDNGLMRIWQSSNNFIDLATGTYDIYIRNAGNTCETPYALNSIQLEGPNTPNLVAIAVNQPTDCQVNNASINITATAGSTNVAYSIDGGINWENTALFENLKPGTYNVLIRNEDGTCEIASSENPIQIDYPDKAQIVEVISTNPSDCGVANGRIAITASSSATNLIYSIDAGVTWQESSIFTNLSGGIYNVRVANSDESCIAIYPTLELIAPSGGTITGVSVTTGCAPTNRSISIKTTSNTPLEYSIDGGATYQSSNNFVNLDYGQYNVLIRNASDNCEVAYTNNPVNIEAPANNGRLIDHIQAGDPTTCEATDGFIEVNASGNNLLYSIDGGINYATQNTFDNLAAGKYWVYVKEEQTGCEEAYIYNPVELIGIEQPTISTVTTTSLSDCKANDGTITIIADGESGLEYSLDGNTWSTGNTFINLLPGLYNAWVRYDDESCQVPYANNPIVIAAPSGPIITDCFGINPNECNVNNGQIIVTATGGSGPLKYSIDGGTVWQNANEFTDLAAGTYSIAVANSDETCKAIHPICILTAPQPPLINEVQTFNPSDCGINNGSLTIFAQGNGGLEYSIDNGVTWSANSHFANLAAGDYQLKVRNAADNCEIEYGAVNLEAPTPPTIISGIENVSICYGNSIPVKIDLNENIAHYTIIGSGGYLNANVSGTTLTFDAYLNGAVSNFTVTLENADGCTVKEEFAIFQAADPMADFIVHHPICAESETTIEFTGEASPGATLHWTLDGATIVSSSAASTTTPAGATLVVQWPTAGGKTIRLEIDDGGCIDKSVQNINVNKLPFADAGEDITICDDACVQLNGVGNGAQFQWSPAIGLSATNIPNPMACPTSTTTYQLTVMGAEGCMVTDEITITVAGELTANAGNNQAICQGETAQLQASGGISYVWTPSTGLSNPNISNPIASPTTITTYSVEVINAFGCVGHDEVVVEIHPTLDVAAGEDAAICVGENTMLAASGAVHYEWSPSTGLSATNVPNPIASPTTTTTYTVIGTDANGCTASDEVSVVVGGNAQANAGSDQTICLGASVPLNASGGVSYSWQPTTGLSNPAIANPIANPTTTTTYIVTVTNAAGCIGTDEVTISVNGLVAANAGPDQTVCAGQTTQLNATGGVHYNWSPSFGLNNPAIANPSLVPIVTTTYTVTITTAQGCTATDQVTVFVGNNASINAGTDQTICQGMAALLNASGGTNYTWSPQTGLSNPNIANPVANPSQTTTYTVTGTTAQGCTATDQVTVFVNANLNVIGCVDKTICQGDGVRLTVNGGISWQWSPSTGLDNPLSPAPYASPNVTTVYTVTGTDAQGCTATDQVTVFVGNNTNINAGTDQTICQGMAALLNASGGTNYTWSPQTGLSNPNIANPVANPSQTTTYTVTGTTAQGCTATDQVTVFVNANLNVIGCADKTICQGDGVRLTVNGGISWQWSPSTGLDNPLSPAPYASPNVTTVYTVTGTDAQGCTATDQVTVFVGNNASINAGADQTIIAGTPTLLNATGGVRYTWSPQTGLSNPNIANPVANPLVTTTYTVTGTTAQGCTATDQLTIFVNNQVQINAGSNQIICQGATVQLNANGGINYTWSPQTGLSNPHIANPIASPSVTTTYTVTGTTVQGIVSTDQVTVTVMNSGLNVVGCPDKTICKGGNVRLTVNGGVSWAWSPATGLDDPYTPAPYAAPSTTTVYTVTGTDANGCTDTDEVVVFVDEACLNQPPTPICTEELVNFQQTTLVIDDCNEKGTLCINLPLETIFNYSLTNNGQTYTDGFTGCNFDTLYAYTYYTLPNRGANGPYQLQSWIIDGQSYTGQFNDLSQLINLMNTIDSGGNWTQDASTLTIKGGIASRNYSTINVSQVNTGALAILELNTNLLSMGTALSFGVGTHNITLTNNSTGCIDNFIVNVNCPESRIDCPSIFDTTSISYPLENCHEKAAICINISTDDLGFYSIEHNNSLYTEAIGKCESDREHIQLYAAAGEHIFSANNELNGCKDEIKIEVTCNNDGRNAPSSTLTKEKDSIKVVQTTNGNVFPIAEADEVRTVSNQPIFIDVQANDRAAKAQAIKLINEPKYGAIHQNADNTFTYQPDEQFCDSDQTDFFQYAICNNYGCDTTTVKIVIECIPIKVYTGFSPNRDDINDYFKIEGLTAYPNNELIIFNRTGEPLKKFHNYQNDWDGEVNGAPLPNGTYFYTLVIEKGRRYSGFLQISR